MYILVALIPAIMWGIIPLLVSKFGGKPNQQILGTTLGAVIFAVILYFFTTPAYTWVSFFASLTSGLFWTVGQYLQYTSFRSIGVSKAMPISTGMQLLGTSLVGVLAFQDWNTPVKLTLGFIALAIIIIGAVLTSYQQKKAGNSEGASQSLKLGIIMTVFSAIGYVIYATIGQAFHVSGWTSILPQSIGMLLLALILSIRNGGERRFSKETFKNIIVGLSWSVGNLALLLSTNEVGVATSFTLSQMGVVISTLGGLFILKEKKTHRELVSVIIGVILVVIGGALIGYIKGL